MVWETPDIFGLKRFIFWSLLCIYYLVHDLKHTPNTLKSYSVLTLPVGFLIFIIIRHIVTYSASVYLPSHNIRPPPNKIIRLIFFSAVFYFSPYCFLRPYCIIRLILSSISLCPPPHYILRLIISSISFYPRLIISSASLYPPSHSILRLFLSSASFYPPP